MRQSCRENVVDLILADAEFDLDASARETTV
jgi:hypothetical protein